MPPVGVYVLPLHRRLALQLRPRIIRLLTTSLRHMLSTPRPTDTPAYGALLLRRSLPHYGGI